VGHRRQVDLLQTVPLPREYFEMQSLAFETASVARWFYSFDLPLKRTQFGYQRRLWGWFEWIPLWEQILIVVKAVP